MALSWQQLSTRLAEPFPAAAVSWRAGAVSRDKKRAQALAYAEPRVYEDRLNEVLGADWSCRFIPWGETRLLCELSVRLEDDAGGERELTRTSTGEFDGGDKVAQGTAAEAQAFKRACSKFGLGRYLYDLPATWVGYDEASRRLTETPSLPTNSLPRPVPAPTPAPSSPAAAPASAPKRTVRSAPKLLDAPAETPAEADLTPSSNTSAPPTLSEARADAMQRELEKLGFLPTEQRKLAGRVLGRRVAAFSELSELEALEVWNVARRSPPKTAPTPRAVGF